MLLDQIINILADSKGDLNDALLKTKVLLHTIGRKDLAVWVTHELKGYTKESDLPDYRILSSEVYGHVVNMRWEHRNFLLPLSNLTDDERKAATVSPCLLPIAEVARVIDEGGKMRRNFPTESTAKFEELLEAGNRVVAAWAEINILGVANILSEVRTRLLDFCLELRDVVGNDVPETELKQKTKGIDTGAMFNGAIFGDNTTLVIGSPGSNVAVRNEKGDVDGLVNAVSSLGLEQMELVELRQAVIADQSEGKTPDVTEGKTGQWFSKVLKKAGKGALKVGVDLAATTIVQAIKQFVGG